MLKTARFSCLLPDTYGLQEVKFQWHERGIGPALTIRDTAKDLPEFDVVHHEQRNCDANDTFVGKDAKGLVHTALLGSSDNF